jgi:tetratricopeptide (TPR) repeat protein
VVVQRSKKRKDFIAAQKLRPNDVDLLFQSSQARMLSGDYRGAIHDMDQALASGPRSAVFLFTRANARIALQQWAAALADLDAAIAIMPDNPAFYSARGVARKKLRL